MSKNAPRTNMPVSIETSYNLPPPEVIRHDIEGLRQERRRCVDAIRANERAIEKQRVEQAELRALADDPGDFNPDACRAAADRCDKHVGMFEALNKKEYAKIDQYDRMILELEKRLCLSETTSR